MRTQTDGAVLLVRDIRNLGATNAALFKEVAHAGLRGEHRVLEVDLSEAEFVDSEGLGALVAVHKRMCMVQGCVRLLRPRPMVLQLLELTRLDGLFEIVRA